MTFRPSNDLLCWPPRQRLALRHVLSKIRVNQRHVVDIYSRLRKAFTAPLIRARRLSMHDHTLENAKQALVVGRHDAAIATVHPQREHHAYCEPFVKHANFSLVKQSQARYTSCTFFFPE